MITPSNAPSTHLLSGRGLEVRSAHFTSSTSMMTLFDRDQKRSQDNTRGFESYYAELALPCMLIPNVLVPSRQGVTVTGSLSNTGS